MNYLEDPLNSEDFDSVQYINQRFPTEASLDDLDSFISNIGGQISTLDDEISKSVQLQSVVGKQASRDIAEAQKSIEELFEKINDIKLKASQSESMVQEICADIKKLDYAKNHLQTSITSLNRLQMLINAVGQLEIIAHEYQYKEVANLLDAVKQFMTHFEKYMHISMIADIQTRVDKIGKELTKHCRKNFRDLAKIVESVADVEVMLTDVPGGLKSIADSCLVVDSLGGKVRRELLEEFVQLQLVSYENLFGEGKEHYSLEQVDRRWAWFKRLLKYIDSKFANIFPQHWRLPLRILLEFIERTKMHLIAMLTDLESRDATDVNALLKALKSTLRFEQEMTDRFNLLFELQQSKDAEVIKAKAIAADIETKMKLKKDDKLMYIPVDHNAKNLEDETESGFLSLAHASVSSGISGVFDKFLGCYVLLERKNLEELIQRLSSEEDVTSEGEGSGAGHGNVYGSSTNMFVFIKNSIKRCTTLTTGQTFLSLSKEFKTCMQQYSDMLRNRCPPAIPGPPGTPPTYRLPVGAEVGICYMINTGEYCAEVVPQLEQMIQQKILPSLSSKVDFNTETEAFMDLVAYSLKVLVAGIMDRLEPSFRTMQSINWGVTTSVGEESPYLHMCNAVLIDAIPKIRDSLSPSYFNNYCTKLATEILQRYLDVILKQKKISEMATQQLLLDTYNIKTLMLQLQQLSSDPSTSGKTGPAPSSMYVKFVNSKVGHIEMILKLIGTPEDMLLERFRIMWPDGQSTDLQMLMSLKGTKRPDQIVILEMFGLSAGGKGGAAKSGNMFTPNASSNPSPIPPTGTTSSIPGAYSASVASAAAAASAAAMASSMKSLTQDLSSQARNAVGNLKWSSGTKN